MRVDKVLGASRPLANFKYVSMTEATVCSGSSGDGWDITGKCYGVPVHKLLGGPTRERVRVYGRVSDETGVNAMKVGPGASRTPFKYVEGKMFVDEVAERFKALRDKYGYCVDIGIDFHGAVQPPTAMLLIKALEPYHPWFFEEIVQALNVDVMAELAKKTHIPIATGERIFTKWGYKEILEKRAATILQPDVCCAGGSIVPYQPIPAWASPSMKTNSWRKLASRTPTPIGLTRTMVRL